MPCGPAPGLIVNSPPGAIGMGPTRLLAAYGSAAWHTSGFAPIGTTVSPRARFHVTLSPLRTCSVDGVKLPSAFAVTIHAEPNGPSALRCSLVASPAHAASKAVIETSRSTTLDGASTRPGGTVAATRLRLRMGPVAPNRRADAADVRTYSAAWRNPTAAMACWLQYSGHGCTNRCAAVADGDRGLFVRSAEQPRRHRRSRCRRGCHRRQPTRTNARSRPAGLRFDAQQQQPRDLRDEDRRQQRDAADQRSGVRELVGADLSRAHEGTVLSLAGGQAGELRRSQPVGDECRRWRSDAAARQGRGRLGDAGPW